MPNPTPSFPDAIFSPPDFSAFGGVQTLGGSVPNLTDAVGRLAEEIAAVQRVVSIYPRFGGQAAWSIAAEDATDAEKAMANETLDGVADEVQINAALAAYEHVRLSSGTFTRAAKISAIGDSTTGSPNITFLGKGGESTVIDGPTNVHGVEISECAKITMGGMQIKCGGTGDGLRSVAGTGGTFRAFWMSHIFDINVIGDFSSHSGWAFNFENPFRSIFDRLFCVGVKNGMYVKATNSAFNPGNCTFTNCFMELNVANGVGYKVESPDNGGNFNIVTFIECDMQDSATSTTSKGWWFVGSTTSFYRSKDIKVFHTNVEGVNTAFDIDDSESLDIHANFVSIEGNGTCFDVDSDSINNRLRVGNLFISNGQTVKILNDANTNKSAPNYLIDCFGYNDSGTMTITTTDATVVKGCGRNGPGTFPADYYIDRQSFNIPVVAPGTNTATGDGKAMLRIPNWMKGYIVTDQEAYVSTPGTTNTLDIQLRRNRRTNATTRANADILSTKLTIDSTEYDSQDAATPAVINASNDDLDPGDVVFVDVDAVHTTPAQGLVVELTVTRY